MRDYTTPSPSVRIGGSAPRRLWVVLLVLAFVCPAVVGRPAKAAEPVNLLFMFGSEKKQWLDDVTKTFNEDPQQGVDSPPIHVTLQPMGSGELVQELKNGDLKPQLVSPASGLFLQLLQPGVLDPPPYRNLVKSPVVIAMWQDKAKALGWPAKPLGWADVFTLAERKAGWGGYGHADWGRFKFAHTDPELSNSGLIAVVAQAYAANNKFSGLTLAEVNGTATRELLAGIGRSVSFYGPSTGTMGEQMSANPSLLDAAVLYENMVIAHNRKPGVPPMVAIYPSDGTFMSDHPVGIVKNVSPAERAAAEKYIAFLLADAQQKKALEFGFRPGVATVPLGPPVDASKGADPAQPAKLLEVPTDPVIIRACQEAWRAAKKPVNVVLAIDISYSMKGQKITEAISGAQELVDLLGSKDKISVLAFNSYLKWVETDVPMGIAGNRDKVKASLAQLAPNWQTKLYDAVDESLKHLAAKPAGEGPDESSCIIVLSDGKDFDSTNPPHRKTLDEVEKAIQDAHRDRPVVIFTIGYGVRMANGEIDKSDLDESALKRIAAASGGEYVLSSPQELHKVLEKLAAFFSSREPAPPPH